jgi:small subunit ribosomal protein S4
MSKYLGPRLRIIRRLGTRLPAFTSKSSKRRSRPGQNGGKKVFKYGKFRKPTEFSCRLIEKQKLRFYYGISEICLVRYVTKARDDIDPTGKILLQQLEIRLDNVVYRLGWRPTIPAARQIVSHGQVLVNAKRVTKSSFSCQPQQIITIRNNPNLQRRTKTNSQERNTNLPQYIFISVDNETLKAVIGPQIDHRNILIDLKELLIIEYYSNRL